MFLQIFLIDLTRKCKWANLLSKFGGYDIIGCVHAASLFADKIRQKPYFTEQFTLYNNHLLSMFVFHTLNSDPGFLASVPHTDALKLLWQQFHSVSVLFDSARKLVKELKKGRYNREDDTLVLLLNVLLMIIEDPAQQPRERMARTIEFLIWGKEGAPGPFELETLVHPARVSYLESQQQHLKSYIKWLLEHRLGITNVHPIQTELAFLRMHGFGWRPIKMRPRHASGAGNEMDEEGGDEEEDDGEESEEDWDGEEGDNECEGDEATPEASGGESPRMVEEPARYREDADQPLARWCVLM